MKTWIFRLILIGVALSTFAAPASASRTLMEVEKRVFELTNDERRRHQLPALTDERTLAAIAQGHSFDMLRRGFFSHVNPDQESVADRVAANHRQLIGVSGENIWSGSGQDQRQADQLARLIVEGWMASPGHRENILRPTYTHLGVAVVASGKDIRATQVFASVVAYLSEPLPLVLRQGSKPNLRMRVHRSNQTPAERFDLWSPGDRKAAIDSISINEPALHAPRGSYWIRFHFPDEKTSDRRTRRYQVFFGPALELR